MAILDTTFYKGADLYSDGDEAENRILEIVKAGKSLNDLETEEVSWPTLYHLSPVRENICNWYPFRKDGRILEIGAGCGAITGALCRSGAEVCSVDLSLRRSTINYERHKDCGNLHLYAGNLNEIVFNEPFDYVIVNGVLEYAGLFTEGETPFRTFLENTRKYLKPDGRLLVAIENRLGLKYFAGAEEDHLGKAYAGIRGYEGEKGIQTFSKSELTQLLSESGFGYTRFYYPYPDYKFPLEIFTDETLKTQHYGKPFQVFDKNRTVLFAEEQVASVLAEDGAAAALANSFLAEAGTQPLPESERTLYVKQNNDRREDLRTGTRIYEQDGMRKVEKYALTEAARGHLQTILANEKELGKTLRVIAGEEEDGRIVYPFIRQQTLDEMLKDTVNRRDRTGVLTVFGNIRKLVSTAPEETEYICPAFEEWFGTERASADRMLCAKPANIDLMPDNVFTENGKLSVTDCEWVTEFPVPVAFLMWRSIERAYAGFPKLNGILEKTEAFAHFGIEAADIPAFEAWTWHFENEYVAPKSGTRFGKRVVRTDLDPETAERTVRKLRQEVNIRDAEIRNLNEQLQTVLNSHSWKMTSGLRSAFGTILPKGGRGRKIIKKAVHLVYRPQPIPALPEGGIPIPTETQRPWEDERMEIPCSEEPTVSIVIPVYNQFHYTWACLKSIREHSGEIPYEVIIADDCSTDETAHMEDFVSGVRVIHNKENLRFLLNCNHAAKSARGEYILFLNNDTQVLDNWLEPLVRLIEDDESIGMVGSKLLYPDGRLQEAGGILWQDGSAWNYGNGKDPEDPEYNYVKEADYISGAAIMIRRNLWEQLGGFDERFVPAYYEDTDLAFQVRAAGYKVMFQPLSRVVHFEGVSNGTDISSGLKAYQAENQKKFFGKWKAVLEAEHEPNGVNVFRAKDRSLRKKHILVVDHYVPMYDKDAGGRCTYMYLKLFVKMGFKVTFIGDNFYRHEPYTTELNQMGIEVLYGNKYYLNWQKWLKENAGQFDYIYLQRPHIAIKYIDLVKEYARGKIVYFAHDLHFIREQREYEITRDPKLIESAKKWKEKEFKLFRDADVGHVVGTYEQKIMQDAFPGKPIRNIPLYIYEELPEEIEKDFGKRKDLLYVGGFGHHPNVDAVLWFAREVLPPILEKEPEIIWHVVGNKPPEEIQELAGEHIIIHGFVPDEELEALYRSCRIAVVPLRYGAGVKGKVVEACYYQIPLVTTPIGAEGLSMAENSMLVEEDAGKMAEAILSLYRDQEALKRLSDNGEQFIRNHFMTAEAERVIAQDFIPD